MAKALNDFVAKENSFVTMFNPNATPLTLKTAKGRQEIADIIDCRLSPENLCCDGELPRAQVRARYAALTKVAKELVAIDPTVKFYEFN